ncbi:MAG: AI-2E family transporter [Gemmatimonadetes bacterium]|nr:AI-2E family transporter [Gemmatimonadota bacterium]
MATDPTLLPDPLTPMRRGWRSADIARAALVALAVWFGMQLLWSVSSLVFLVFLATLFGLAVGRGVDYLERWRIRRGVGAALIVFGTLGSIGGVLAWTAPTLIEQGAVLRQEFPAAIGKVQQWLDSRGGGWMKAILPTTPAADSAQAPPSQAVAPPDAVSPSQAASQAVKDRWSTITSTAAKYLFSFVTNTLAVITAFVLLVFLAIYIGAEPHVYRGWLLAAVPASSRAQARLIMAEVATVLRKWLVTQLIAMVVIGSVCTVALLLLDVKAAFALGFIAGLMEFIPTVGPVLSAVPAVLMGFVDSPEKALAVAALYWGIQFLENNLLIPYLMRGGMDLPPAITLLAQTLMTLVFGFLGLMVAVPLTAAVLVPLRMVAERENVREKVLVREEKRQQMEEDEANAEKGPVA